MKHDVSGEVGTSPESQSQLSVNAAVLVLFAAFTGSVNSCHTETAEGLAAGIDQLKCLDQAVFDQEGVRGGAETDRRAFGFYSNSGGSCGRHHSLIQMAVLKRFGV